MKTLLPGFRYRGPQKLEQKKPQGVIAVILLLLLLGTIGGVLYLIWPYISSWQKLKDFYQYWSNQGDTDYFTPGLLVLTLAIVGGLSYNIVSRLFYGSALMVIDTRDGLVIYPYEDRRVRLMNYKQVSVKKDVQNKYFYLFKVYAIKQLEYQVTYYLVQIETGRPGKALLMASGGKYKKARAQAEELARFTGLPLVDYASGQSASQATGGFDEFSR